MRKLKILSNRIKIVEKVASTVVTLENKEQTQNKKPEILDGVDIYTMAKDYTPVGWSEVFIEKLPEIKYVSNLLKTRNEEITPDISDIFNAFYLTPLAEVRVVILGMDPYPTPGVATGLAFSCNTGVPPSLRNIYKEIANCYPENYVIPSTGNLEHWASQGVFLLNACLTCKVGQSNSHAKFSIWTPFVSHVLKAIGSLNKNCFYLLWGKQAQTYKQYIRAANGRILEAAHPSPLSANRGFFGCSHFKLVNDELKPPIVW